MIHSYIQTLIHTQVLCRHILSFVFCLFEVKMHTLIKIRVLANGFKPDVSSVFKC